MKFSHDEINLAKQLKQKGLPWEPAAGHYVFDETGFCKQTSPFQEHVYFILNYDYFMKAVGGVERFKEIMTWLPTWHDSRKLLHSLGVDDSLVTEKLQAQDAIRNGTERLALYEMLDAKLN